MANVITTHNRINSIRNDNYTNAKNLQKCFKDLFSDMKCNYMGETSVVITIEEIKSLFNKVEQQLYEAQKAATALAEVKICPVEKKIAFSASANKGSHKIDINVNLSSDAINGIKATVTRFREMVNSINSCKSEISALKVSDQTISSVSFIDMLFAGVLGNIKTATGKVKSVKQLCVDNLNNAASNMTKLANVVELFSKDDGKARSVLNNFNTCEDNAFRDYKGSLYKEHLKRTSAYNEGNVPEEAKLKDEITQTNDLNAYIFNITCESCKELEEEVTRLDDLYENNYGYTRKIEELKNKPGFGQGAYSSDNNMNYMSWVEEYKGIKIRGKQCYAMAYMMQIELTGKKGLFASNNKYDIKPGDVIHYHGYNTDSEHWAFVYKREGNKIYLAEGNHGKPPIVNYTSVIDLDAPNGVTLKSGYTYPAFSFDGASGQNNGFGIYRP